MKKILFTTIVLLFSISLIHAQESESKEVEKDKLYIELKDGANPDIYVDGKKFEFPIELIDQDKIKTIFVVKGEDAIAKYKAPNGVILITTKTKAESAFSKIKIRKNDNDKGEKTPLVIIDGIVSDKKNLDTLKPADIEKMEVLKGEQAIKRYNSPNGAIIITLKKK
ncbi:TonB-dependent receptor plug domain-containing protein [Polaribacter sp. Asnod1-A03]|uniref:TonB-dependent receptor plug domain-containing protein n=1 Tax=Polaribacter sp. Asnod1-A03 TaxID=3160581 RepID=UPI00386826BF